MKDIGIDQFEDKIEILAKSKYYIQVKQQPQLKLLTPDDMILDHEFAHLYQTLKSSICRMLTAEHVNSTDSAHIDPISTNVNEQQISTMIMHNDFNQQKVEQINIYKKKEKQFIEKRDMHKNKIMDLDQQIQEIKDKIALLDVSSE
ncbi:unnamed protein product [Rotaria socialis]|uniref:Uncharacterized protein n=1 Tax=Rotaria socialis TaxID=392032 RepID=A0A817XZ97_9BILA|nr:unnamed protein product [Rotaria socialis]CAF4708235.1 unnamed protein product [Rotaria socialis]